MAVVAAVVVMQVDVGEGGGEEGVKGAAFVCVADVETEEGTVQEGEVFGFFEEEVAPVAHVFDEVGDAVLYGFCTNLGQGGAEVLSGEVVFVFPGEVAGVDDDGGVYFGGEGEGVGDDFDGGAADGFEDGGYVDAAGGGVDAVVAAVGFEESCVGEEVRAVTHDFDMVGVGGEFVEGGFEGFCVEAVGGYCVHGIVVCVVSSRNNDCVRGRCDAAI